MKSIKHGPQNEDTATVIVALSLDISISEQEDRKDDSDNIPSRENKPAMIISASIQGLES